MGAVRMIAVDWGSTQLRCWLLGDEGQVLAERTSPAGASRIDGGPMAFDTALQAAAGDWLDRNARVVACGMVGSTHGWREVPYLPCPMALADLRHGMAEVRHSSGASVHLVPGMICNPQGGAPDVMRGEETQLVGALATFPALGIDSCVVMPGTHSKWSRLQDGQLVAFQTRMSGELFAVLWRHSVLGRLMPSDNPAFDGQAFDAGVGLAQEYKGKDLGHHLFSVRTLGVTRRLPPSALPDYLSGLLIGSEVIAGLSNLSCGIALLGEPMLCERYRRALEMFGVEPTHLLPNTAASGLWQLASQFSFTPDD